MNEYYHAWNTVFEGMPKPFWQLAKSSSNLRYDWEKLPIQYLEAKGISKAYIDRFKSFRTNFDVAKSYEQLLKSGIKVLSYRDDEYPRALRNMNTHNFPVVLYVKGNLPSGLKTNLSVVGTRNMTAYGQIITEKIISELKYHDFVITSGLANGVDSHAHKCALDNGMPTVAVLGFGINQIPDYKQNLAEKIVANGAIISEYPPDLTAQKHHFPLRNRIIAGLSRATVVIEAGEKSGALITARYALDHGREVFAVPGSLFNEKSAGTNRLIQLCGAEPLLKPTDILDHLEIPYSNHTKLEYLSTEQKNIVRLLKKSPKSIHELIGTLIMQTSEINSIITDLEINGIIKKDIQGLYHVQ